MLLLAFVTGYAAAWAVGEWGMRRMARAWEDERRRYRRQYFWSYLQAKERK